MGEMTIRGIDETILDALSERAATLGMSRDDLAKMLLRRALHQPGGRAAVARAIQAAQPQRSPFDSVDLIREDRER